MDPLFGFIDDITVQHPEENNAGPVGEYTISYPTDQSQQQFQLHQSNNAQFSNNTTDSSSAQVVHVVSENSQNEKQIYVIKLENFLKDDRNPDDTTIKFEGTEAETDEQANNEVKVNLNQGDSFDQGLGVLSSTESSSNEEEEEDPDQEAKEEEPGPDPQIAVSPEAVMAMAQSVGVDLNEDDASQLGCIAINKLRHALLIAIQFSQNENAEGIKVEHFAKAEEQLGSPGIGQESVFRESAYKYVGGVSVIDDGPEIDLYAAMHQQNISEIDCDETDAVLNVHHMRAHSSTDQNTNFSSNFQLYDELIAECCDDDKDAGNMEEESSDPVAPTAESEVDPLNGTSGEQLLNNATAGDSQSSITGQHASADNDSSDEEISLTVNEFLKENPSNESKTEESTNKTDKNEGESSVNLAPEWVSYLQMLIEEIIGHSHNQDFSYSVNSHFNMILRDIHRNGVTPIFHVLCDTFRDYLREPKISRDSIMNIISIVDALISSNAEPTMEQLTDLGSVLIEIIILPSPCDVNNFLMNVFMKIMKNCNELLTWTCTYVTEMLKGVSEIPFDQISNPFKSTMHGALCLANGLEDLKIQVAQEFGWHSSVMNFSRNHCSVFDGEAYSPTSQDTSLEEEILKFYCNFMKNYTSLVPPTELSQIRDCITTLYGERFSSFVPPSASPSPPSMAKIYKTKPAKTQVVFRKITYKDKEITVPCRKVVK